MILEIIERECVLALLAREKSEHTQVVRANKLIAFLAKVEMTGAVIPGIEPATPRLEIEVNEIMHK